MYAVNILFTFDTDATFEVNQTKVEVKNAHMFLGLIVIASKQSRIDSVRNI